MNKINIIYWLIWGEWDSKYSNYNIISESAPNVNNNEHIYVNNILITSSYQVVNVHIDDYLFNHYKNYQAFTT